MSEARPSDRQGSASAVPALELRGISKAFPGVIANDHVSFSVSPGEVRCLLGENGAGKSTIVSIVAGMQQPDAGGILVDGVEVRLASPQDALRNGIGVVYQHSTLIPAFSVLENLMLTEDASSRGIVLDRSGARRRFAELSQLLGISVDVNAKAGDLGLGQQQQVEIVRALWRGSRILVLDEPTSMLTPQGIADLETTINRLAAEGIAIVLITHKLREVIAVGSSVTVLRAGKSVLSYSREELTRNDSSAGIADVQPEIVSAMFGEEMTAPQTDTRPRPGGDVDDRTATATLKLNSDPVLELRGVSTTSATVDGRITDIDVSLHAGEIMGIAGIDGNGQRGLAEVIAGQRQPAAGSLVLEGEDITSVGVRGRQRRGLRYVTDDRTGEGSVGGLSVALNLVLKRIGERPFWKRGVIQRGQIDAEARQLVRDFDIRTPSINARAATLSGGNLQKLLLARELAHSPRVLIVSKPTYGLDTHTVDRVRALLKGFVDGGGAILLLSADLDELVQLAHRIGVLEGGRLVAVVKNDGDDVAAAVGSIMAGGAG
ncbi:putative B6 ABC transporter ATP-binding protein [Lysinibacter cavernae]|uniref:Simple sugar transport system ATP-binding protein n=1 Tax=Lysinibacter cavernae TaxID=1640652 RepID=A0A7X5R222_9MICO|nr:simple sugar transport system ATP-binding protein [Lysinibacter cavernae]